MAVVASLRTLLAAAVDYAGLYPPASVDMAKAVSNYAAYRNSDASWMLGRFVLPISGLSEFEEAWGNVDEPTRLGWRLSAVLGEDAVADIARAHVFNETFRGRAQIDSVEARLSAPGAIARATEATKHRIELFVEVTTARDFSSIISAIGEWGVNAKIRTGGTTPDAFPDAAIIARFIRECVDKRIPFKATAGLHHPLRAQYRLTYEPDAPRGMMFGYLNVFVATAFGVAGMPHRELTRVLEESDPTVLRADDEHISWRDRPLTLDQLRDARQWIRSFGSCSFREPVDELETLALRS